MRSTSKPVEVTPAENPSANAGEEGRISCAIITVAGSRSLSKKRAKANPVAKEKSGVISELTSPRMS